MDQDPNPNLGAHRRRWLAPLLALALAATDAVAVLDLRNAEVERLANGLTLMTLVDRNFPVASVQMLYRVGARNETAGRTGLAHFLEHMAFRASENFPDTALVSSIYARGGEWHGYTWIDQTTYFATVPRQHLDLLLRIEADRMARLTLAAGAIEAEKGAVLAELHMYENDPTTLLLDALMLTSFLAHPYRNNTIGLESDIEHLRHEDVVAFYRRHYHPGNAVLAVVGDINERTVQNRVGELFGSLPGRAPTPLPHTRELPQTGERRVSLAGHGDRRFMIGYRAPSAASPDFPPFLVLQQWLGASSGVNFLHNDWGTPVAEGAVLDGAADALTTWFPPSAQDYLFVIGGRAGPNGGETGIEQEIERRIAAARSDGPDPAALSAAVDGVLDELVYDIETTEDAAHQLAFFAGLDALDVLLELPQRVASVTAEDVRRVAAHYLAPRRRTIVWYGPPSVPGSDPAPAAAAAAAPVSTARAPIDERPVATPLTFTLGAGLPAILQPSDLSRAIHLRIVLMTAAGNDPVLGFSSLSARLRPDRLDLELRRARAALADWPAATAEGPVGDPMMRLEQAFAEIFGAAATAGTAAPALIVLAGDVEAGAARALLQRHFDDLSPAPLTALPRPEFRPGERVIRLGRPVAQAALGYVVPAPGPLAEGAEAFRLLSYILSHDYEGRLGKEAISRRGLAYYIDTRYRSDGRRGWITLATGVDPGKLHALAALLQAELERLAAEPPSEAEVDEAKAHLAGRARSAAQSNAELTAARAEQFLWYGATQSPEELEERLAAVSRQDVLAVVPAFARGLVIEVRE